LGINKDGLVNEWNKMAETITGYCQPQPHRTVTRTVNPTPRYSIDEVLGKGLVAKFITPDYKGKVWDVLDRAMKGEQASNFEFPLKTASGAMVEILLNATTRRDSAGVVIGVIGVGQDITHRKLAEKELGNVAQELRAIIDTANAPIFGIDLNGHVNEWNKMAAHITRYPSQEVMNAD